MTAQTEARAVGDPYMRIVDFFDRDETAGSFLREDGEGGFVGGIYRMAREIESLRASSAAKNAEIAALKKEAADVVRPFAEQSRRFDEAAVRFNHPLSADDSRPKTDFKHGELRAARSFLDKWGGRDG